MRRIGWGIAGAGWVARDFAMPAITAAGNSRLVALHDRSTAALMSAQGLAPKVSGTRDLAQFLATPGLDAVYVATPNDAHRSIVEAAAAAGLPVLCEKPMATNLADAIAMVEACRRAAVPYATAFDQRFHPIHQELRRLIAAGRIGKVTAIRIVYACWLPTEWAARKGSADNWRIDVDRAGGGALIDLAPHGLDLAQMLLGDELNDIAALGQRRVHDYAVEDGAALIARTAGDVLVQLHVAYNCPETLPRRRLEIVGTLGQLTATDSMGQTAGGRLDLIQATDGHTRALTVPDAAGSPFQRQIEAFADCLLTGKPFAYSPERDLSTMRLIMRAQAQAAHFDRSIGGNGQVAAFMTDTTSTTSLIR